MNFIKRVLRALFTWKMAGRLLFAGACVATIIALLIVEENWRQKRAWEAFKNEHEARGDRLDMAALIPPPVPDEQNFATTPLIVQLSRDRTTEGDRALVEKLQIPNYVKDKSSPGMGDRQKGRHFKMEEWDALFPGGAAAWLRDREPELKEISEASRRPYSQFPIEYEKGFAMSLPHMTPLNRVRRIYQLRAEVELAAGQPDAALADVQTIFRLADSVKDEPYLISQLVRIMIWQSGMQVVWEGLEGHRWTEMQLAALQEDTGRVDFLGGLLRAFHGERAGLNATVLMTITNPNLLVTMMSATNEDTSGYRLLRYVPSGLLYENMTATNRFYEKYIFPSVDPVARRVHPEIVKAAEQELTVTREINMLGVPFPNFAKALQNITMPAIYGIAGKVAYQQDAASQATIACALERYRLANGQFPAALEKLTPAFLQEIPPNVVNGEPPHYKLNDDGTYLLYSDGWDGKDDGGKQELREMTHSIDLMKSDWVWSGKVEEAGGK